MQPFARSDDSVIARWWWSVDHLMLALIIIVVGIGVLLNFSASPVIAERIGRADPYEFLKKQLIFLPVALAALVFFSFQTPKNIRRWALVIFAAAFVLMIGTLFVDAGVKGGKRWIPLFGLVTLQPSEFIKPAFAVLCAWFLAKGTREGTNQGIFISLAMLAAVALVLLCQPDMGMTFTLCAIWGFEMFMAGISMVLVLIIIAAVVVVGVAAYFTMPHFHSRIESFLNPEAAETYQIDKAIDAFRLGGLFGRGPGEGKIKGSIPDAHTDFIMAVAGEEFGFFLCMIIVLLFAFILFRGFALAYRENKLFSLIAVAGLLVQFGVQAVVNMASSLHLIPTKGMTLPFISYGGSSLISMGIGMGMVLALTRRRAMEQEE